MLRDLVPTHEFAFQVLAQQAVKFNEFRRFPLLKALDWLETNFRPYNPEQELQVGLFRVPVPKGRPSRGGGQCPGPPRLVVVK